MKKTKIDHYSDKEALDFHNSNKAGKIEIISSKPMTSKRDLALAYSPGVAAPVREIAKNPDAAYDYTTKGNLVAVISNGSAILGMGNLGALASKPVMEGKAVLFKRFADIDAIDLEIDSSNANEIIKSIKNFSKSFGGINLEDIAAPDCFIIEEKLKEILDIPVFHDDQHGTAIITYAALINALDIAKKNNLLWKNIYSGVFRDLDEILIPLNIVSEAGRLPLKRGPKALQEKGVPYYQLTPKGLLVVLSIDDFDQKDSVLDKFLSKAEIKEKEFVDAVKTLVKISPKFTYSMFEIYVRAFCEGKLKNLLPFSIPEFQKISENVFTTQNELLTGFMTLPKSKKLDVLNFFSKFT